jgi:uncharacterized protein YqhQ
VIQRGGGEPAKTEPRYLGGQAVMGGVMMRGEHSWAVSVRRPDGEIETRLEDAPGWAQGTSKIPLVRGVVALGEAMSLGVRALMWSAAKSTGEDVKEPTRAQVAGTVASALVMFSALFLLFPALVSKSAGGLLDTGLRFNVFEGVFRLTLFVAYIAAVGRIPDIRRVFQYHGAEHKVIAAYEQGQPLTPTSAQRFTTQHVRCGTSFMLIVLVLAIATHTLFGRPGWGVLVVSRVLTVPFVAAIAYELIRAGARHVDKPFVLALMRPGLLLQRLTTREPDFDQLEVALTSLRAVLTAEQLAEVEARAELANAVTGAPAAPSAAPAIA